MGKLDKFEISTHADFMITTDHHLEKLFLLTWGFF